MSESSNAEVFDLAPVAQLDRAAAYGAVGWGFDSLRAYNTAPILSSCTAFTGLDTWMFRRALSSIGWNLPHNIRVQPSTDDDEADGGHNQDAEIDPQPKDTCPTTQH
jgi:hypothetical protein